MNEYILHQNTKAKSITSNGNSLYLFGCLAALGAVLLYLLDMSISFAGGDTGVGGLLTAVDWFSYIQTNPILGLRALGLMNVVSLTFGIVLFAALLAAHQKESKYYAAVAVIFFVVGAAVYISNNSAISMAVLSSKYAAAVNADQRTLLAAAGEAALAQGEDFTPGSFTGFFFTEIASFIISTVMLKGRIFNKAAGITGILGSIFLAIFTVLATFVPAVFDAAMMLAMIGGLLSIAWYILTARRMFQLSKLS